MPDDPLRPEDRCRACGEFWPCDAADVDPSHTATPRIDYGCYFDGRRGTYAVLETSREIVRRAPNYPTAKAIMDDLTASLRDGERAAVTPTEPRASAADLDLPDPKLIALAQRVDMLLEEAVFTGAGPDRVCAVPEFVVDMLRDTRRAVDLGAEYGGVGR